MQSLRELKSMSQLSIKRKRSIMVLLGKAKLKTIEILIYNILINSYIGHDDFVSVNNVLRENNEMKKEIKNPEISA